MKDIIIIGGGASGLVAAIEAARNGAQVTVLERQNRIGKKILVTGNGRCNVTNLHTEPEHFHTASKKNPYVAIQKVSVEETMTFFKTLGIEPLVEKTKVYPASEQASSVLDVLRMELERLGVNLVVEEKVVKIKQQGHKWQVQTEKGTLYEAQSLIVATGGLAAPALGCDETGYQLLQSLGHRVVTPFPTLVHITSPSKYCKTMQGMRFKGTVSIWVEGKMRSEERGEVLFTEDGLSGPPIFQLSRIAAECALKKKKGTIRFDLMPKYTEAELVGMIYERLGQGGHKTIEELFVGWLNKRAIVCVVKEADIGSLVAPCENLDYEMIEALAKAMKALPFEVTGTRNYKFAQATAGGICLDEIDLETMASLKAPHVYVTGEVLDVDGDCGGYNLQWAWSTGMIAGRSASLS